MTVQRLWIILSALAQQAPNESTETEGKICSERHKNCKLMPNPTTRGLSPAQWQVSRTRRVKLFAQGHPRSRWERQSSSPRVMPSRELPPGKTPCCRKCDQKLLICFNYSMKWDLGRGNSPAAWEQPADPDGSSGTGCSVPGNRRALVMAGFGQ